MPDPLERLATALADRYRIERELGAGGVAAAYLAEDPKHRMTRSVTTGDIRAATLVVVEHWLGEIRAMVRR